MIDAQWVPYREKFTAALDPNAAATTLSELVDLLHVDRPPLYDATMDMDGAVADGLSRLVLRYEFPPDVTPPDTLTFRLKNKGPALVTHHTEEAAVPFGSLSGDGITKADWALDWQAPVRQSAFGFHAAVTVFRPPTFFPYTQGEPIAVAELEIAVEDPKGRVLALKPLLLVRPPVMALHGLFGNRESLPEEMRTTLADNGILYFRPDFSDRHISGFDRIFDIIPTELAAARNALRAGNHHLFFEGKPKWVRATVGKAIAATKLDFLAHSMGGVLVRWYTTDTIARQVQPLGRGIWYPNNVVDPSLRNRFISADIEGRLGPLERSRAATPNLLYRRRDNFNQGDLGSVIVYGSPLRGSPLGNAVTHQTCSPDLRALCFDPGNPPPLLTNRRVIYARASAASRQKTDAGAAVYDLAMGSTAYRLFSLYDSEPVRVHAIGTTVKGDNSVTGWVAQLMGGATAYCPGFDSATSDRIVPIESQLANLAAYHYSPFKNAWHNSQGELRPLRGRVAELLVDTPRAIRDPEAYYENKFPADRDCYPLECGAKQCQPLN